MSKDTNTGTESSYLNSQISELENKTRKTKRGRLKRKLTPVQKWTLSYLKKCNEAGIKAEDHALGIYLNLKGCKSEVADRDKDYVYLKAYSNSKLSRLLDQFLGNQPKPLPYEAFGVGSVVHQQLLEPEICPIEHYFLTPAKERDIKGMIKSLRRDRATSYALKNGETEVVVIWNDKATKALCKGKLDIRTATTAYDIKTTGAVDKEQFVKSCYKYGYDRQAAMYLDGSDKQYFKFIAVQKSAPYNVFHLTFHRNDPEIIEARKKYQFIIKKALEAGL